MNNIKLRCGVIYRIEVAYEKAHWRDFVNILTSIYLEVYSWICWQLSRVSVCWTKKTMSKTYISYK
jgi:hypothetical protein